MKREVPGLSPGAPQSAKGATALLGLHQLPRRLPEEAAGPGFSPGTPQSPEGATALLDFHQLPRRLPEEATRGRRGFPPDAPQSRKGATALLRLHQLPRRLPEEATGPGLSPGAPPFSCEKTGLPRVSPEVGPRAHRRSLRNDSRTPGPRWEASLGLKA